MQNVCGPVCAGRKVKADKKGEREKVKQRKEALRTIAELIALAQTAFNEYVRLRDFNKGCFVCHRPFDQSVIGRRIHAGHVRSRGAAGHLRFVEDNCHGECEGCNGPHGAKPHQIKAGAIERIGEARFNELEADNNPHKWTREELIATRAKYRALAKELKKGQE
jgi:5-methylcytosine-specific restriction endonuclease McrA